MNKWVPGKGNKIASIMFIGEAPGATELELGEPFVGRSGKILDKWLETLELNREDVYITNAVKDALPNNRRPTKTEIKIYNPMLKAEIFFVRPKLIFVLGATAYEALMGEIPNMKDSVGTIITIELNGQETYVVPLFHPSYASRFKKLTVIDKILKRFVKDKVIKLLTTGSR